MSVWCKEYDGLVGKREEEIGHVNAFMHEKYFIVQIQVIFSIQTKTNKNISTVDI